MPKRKRPESTRGGGGERDHTTKVQNREKHLRGAKLAKGSREKNTNHLVEDFGKGGESFLRLGQGTKKVINQPMESQPLKGATRQENAIFEWATSTATQLLEKIRRAHS